MQLKEIQLTSPLFGYYQRKRREKLKDKYGFDRWHCGSVYERPYVKNTIDLINSLELDKRGDLIEVGCGLGDIISNVNWNGTRHGYDISREVLKAANTDFGKVKYSVGGIEDVLEDRIELFIMVNFIHGMNPNELKQMVQNNLSKTEIKCFVIDSLRRIKYSEYKSTISGEYIFGNQYVKCAESVETPAAHGAVRRLEAWMKID